MIEHHITSEKPHYTSKEFNDHTLKTFKQIEFSHKYTDKVSKVLPLKKPTRTRTPSSEPPPPSSSQTALLPRIASSCFGTNNLQRDLVARIRTCETRSEMIQVLSLHALLVQKYKTDTWGAVCQTQEIVIRAKANKLLQTLREHRGEKGEMELDFRENHLQRLQETDGLRDEVSNDCDAEGQSQMIRNSFQ